MVIMGFIMLGKIFQFGYYQYTKYYPVGGTLILSKVEEIELVNPNDIQKSMVINLKPYILKYKRYLISPNLQKDGIYFLGISSKKQDKTIPFSIVKLSKNGFKTLPITIDNTERKAWGGLLYVTPLYFYIIDKSQVYQVNRENFNVTLIHAGLQTHKGPLSYQRNTPIISYGDGIIGTNEKNEVLYIHDGQVQVLFSIPYLLFKGWYKMGENFLAYDWQNEKSVEIDFHGNRLFTFGQQPYDVLGYHKDGLLLALMPQGESGTTPLDIEVSWHSLLEYDVRTPFAPFIYDFRTKNARLIHRNISIATIITNNWQNVNYNELKFNKYKEAAMMSRTGPF